MSQRYYVIALFAILCVPEYSATLIKRGALRLCSRIVQPIILFVNGERMILTSLYREAKY